MKKYTLMHKNFPVADLELDEAQEQFQLLV